MKKIFSLKSSLNFLKWSFSYTSTSCWFKLLRWLNCIPFARSGPRRLSCCKCCENWEPRLIMQPLWIRCRQIFSFFIVSTFRYFQRNPARQMLWNFHRKLLFFYFSFCLQGISCLYVNSWKLKLENELNFFNIYRSTFYCIKKISCKRPILPFMFAQAWKLWSNF